MASTLRDALVDEIKDLYNAEKQLLKALPKLSKAASSSDLKDALDAHREETKGQVTRLEQVFEALGERARGKTCHGIAGIIDEGTETIDENFDDEVMDAAIIAAAQRAEHYEIAAYGTAAAWAEALNLDEVAELLSQTLEEEKAADEKLTGLAEEGINGAATAGTDTGTDTGTAAGAGARTGRGNGAAKRAVSRASR